jgi:hypothetical protein
VELLDPLAAAAVGDTRAARAEIVETISRR